MTARRAKTAFTTDGPTVPDILVHLGEPITPPTAAPARGPPLWELPPPGQREIEHAYCLARDTLHTPKTIEALDDVAPLAALATSAS